MSVNPKLNARTTLYLLVPPLLWAANALLGRVLSASVPPLQLNALRWGCALLLLLPLAWRAVGTPPRRAEVFTRWRPLALLGLCGVGIYNALQYMALHTSSPVNVTLIASSAPVWMLLVGALFFGEKPHAMQWWGATLSLLGVLTVMARGDIHQLRSIQFVRGDVWMLLAALSWAFYSWQLAKPAASLVGAQRPAWTWAEFLWVQTLFGFAWAGLFASAESLIAPQAVVWSPGLLAALAFLAIGPSILAYRCWGLGVAAVGPALAAFFANLTPLFAALMSALWLGQPPQTYHALAFALIVAGIVVSNKR
jgi:drug/metabolite transporter (DMT)-like permease